MRCGIAQHLPILPRFDMAQPQPIGGGTYYRDADGELHRIADDQLEFDPETRTLKLPRLAPKPPVKPAAPAAASGSTAIKKED